MALSFTQQSSYSTQKRTYSTSSLSGWAQKRVSAASSKTYASSVHGGLGGRKISTSQPTAVFSSYDEYSVIGDEKATMQMLNDRLANYLEKVHSLEKKNKELQQNITEYCKKSAVVTRDYTGYFSTINDLRAAIAKRSSENQAITLQIDSAQLAAEDFKMKYETEMHLRMLVEGDVARLRGVRDDLTLIISDLELRMEGLKEDLVFLKSNHMEEINQLRIKSSGSVNVEVDSGESVDLSKILQDLREEYEGVIAKNKLEVEKWYQAKMAALHTEIGTYQADVKTVNTELSDLRRTYQTLEINRQSAHAEISCYQESLEEMRAQQSARLYQLQMTITSLENQLQQLNNSRQQQQTEYNQLMDIKMRLELEIAEYRRLLEGEAYEQKKSVVISKVVEVEEHKPHIEKRVKTIVEEIVDGKVVSSSVDTQIETVQ